MLARRAEAFLSASNRAATRHRSSSVNNNHALLVWFQRQQQKRLLSSSISLNDGTAISTPSAPPLILPHPHSQEQLTMKTVAAPMVAASDYAFRCLCRQYGTDLAYTQMLHAKNLCVTPSPFLRNHLDLFECYDTSTTTTTTTNKDYAVIREPSQERLRRGLTGSQCELPTEWQTFQTGPLIVQLAGHDPAKVLHAAQAVLEHTPHVTGFDLNCGCPQGIAKKGHYGAFLMESDNGETVCQVLSHLRENLPRHVTVSAKIRLPLNPEELAPRIQALVGNTGIDFLAVHGRNLLENKNLVRAAHTDGIQQVTRLVQQIRPIPIIANGGIETFPDVQRVQQETGASAIMSSEGLLETPQVFLRDTSLLTARQRLEEQFQVTRDYLRWAAVYPPVPGVLGSDGGSFMVVKSHLFKFLHRYWTEQPELRNELVKPTLNSLAEVHELVDKLYQRYQDFTTDEEMQELKSSHSHASWYRRHWSQTNAAWYRKFWNSNGHHSDNKDGGSLMDLSVEERKKRMQERIRKLQELKASKKATLSSLS